MQYCHSCEDFQNSFLPFWGLSETTFQLRGKTKLSKVFLLKSSIKIFCCGSSTIQINDDINSLLHIISNSTKSQTTTFHSPVTLSKSFHFIVLLNAITYNLYALNQQISLTGIFDMVLLGSPLKKKKKVILNDLFSQNILQNITRKDCQKFSI